MNKNKVQVRDIVLGEGKPKICVPIVGVTGEDILNEAKLIHRLEADIVEWRVDWFKDVFDLDQVKAVLTKLREVLENTPILFTFRTSKEGGERAIEVDDYVKLNCEVVKTGDIDLVDVEAFTGETAVKRVIETAHAYNVKVVASNHDFDGTPEKDEIIKRLCMMQEQGADIPKIAVMPQSAQDVLTLLAATEEMNRLHATQPIVTMSMGSKGIISRLSGEVFGSAMTFGAAKLASAPGQISVEKLADILNILHS